MLANPPPLPLPLIFIIRYHRSPPPPPQSYADVIVHRVLMAALGLRPLPESLRDRELMHGVVDNLNVRHRWAAAGRETFQSLFCGKGGAAAVTA